MTQTTNMLGQPVGAPVSGAFPLAHPPADPMVGRYVSVVPLDPARDGSDLYSAFAEAPDAGDWTYMGYGPFDDETAFQSWLDGCSSEDPMFHTLLDAKNRPSGLAAYLRVDRNMGTIEVGHIHIAPHLQRSPAATEAMAMMMGRVFDLGYRRYEWKCDSLNARSRRSAERLGFTYEGTFRQAMHYKGRNRDTAWYSVIDSEWPGLKSRFDRWLAPGNFAPDGQQRKPLTKV